MKQINFRQKINQRISSGMGRAIELELTKSAKAIAGLDCNRKLYNAFVESGTRRISVAPVRCVYCGSRIEAGVGPCPHCGGPR